MDDKQATNAKPNDVLTWREDMTSSPRLPVLKSGRSRNPFATSGRQRRSMPIDITTKRKRTVNEAADSSLSASDALIRVPETETKDNKAVENGTSNENYIRLADDADDSTGSCSNDTENMKHVNTCVHVETANSLQTSGWCFSSHQ